jgi:predicted transglutaminase-like cysteine proteinase
MVIAMTIKLALTTKKKYRAFLLAAMLGIGASAQAATSQAPSAGAPVRATPYFTVEFLGGVALPSPNAIVEPSAYRIAVSSAFGPITDEERVKEEPQPMLDPIQTGAVIPGVFGSVAISMRNFPASARWASVYKAIRACGNECDRLSPGFAFIVDAVKNKNFSDKLAFVNSGINQLIAYRKDSATYGRLDYWASPEETLRRRAGDCEDFAILKMAALLQAGVPASSMSLVVLQDTKRRVFHAVLSVSTSNGAFILDILDNAVVKDTSLSNYAPLYSFSTDRAWVHGTRTGESRVASLKGGFAGIAPGEGAMN